MNTLYYTIVAFSTQNKNPSYNVKQTNKLILQTKEKHMPSVLHRVLFSWTIQIIDSKSKNKTSRSFF